MLDHYSSFEAPCVVQRRKDAAQTIQHYHQCFSRLPTLQYLIAQAVDDIKPGSYIGYQMYSRSLIHGRVIELCAPAYTKYITAKWLLIVRCKRMARRLRQRVAASYAPCGLMYKVVAKRTLIGR